MLGKKIMAGEPIYQFSTGECIGWSRRRNIGVIEEITDTTVKVFNDKNPEGYKNYELKRSDFDKWVKEKLYILQ
jgi:hypothetical protein